MTMNDDRRRLPNRILCPLLFVAGAGLFFALRNFAVIGGDTNSIFSPRWAYMWDARPLWYVREPLAHLLVQATVWLVGDLRLAFQTVSALMGGAYLAVLALYSRDARFWAVNLLTVVMLEFVGHLEYYAPLAVLLALYFYLLTRALTPGSRVRPWHVLAVYGVTYLCHKLAIIYAPTLLWLLVRRGEGGGWGWRRDWGRREWEKALGCAVAGLLLDLAPQFLKGGLNVSWLRVQTRDDVLSELITPLTPALAEAIARRSTTGSYFWFTMGTALHWQYFLGFLAATAPLGLPLLALLWRRVRGEAAWALATASLLGVGWMFLWHPHMGWPDWDLFAMGALPINLLAGGLWAGLWGTPAKPQQAPPETADGSHTNHS